MTSPALGEGTRDPATYVPIHLGILTSPKAERLARLLKVPQVSVIGAVARLSLIVQHHAPDGRLDGWSLEDIGAAAGAPARKTEAWAEALIATGWIDVTEDGYAMHDWGEYGGRGVAERAKERDKKRRQRATAKAPAGDTEGTAQGTSPGRPGDTEGTSRPKEEVEEEAEERGSARTTPPAASSPASSQLTGTVQGTSPGHVPASKQPASSHGASARGRGLMGRGVLGLEEQAIKPKTIEELLERHGASLTATKDAAAVVFDGRNGRPALHDVLTELWPNWSENYDLRGPAVALAKLKGWLSDRAVKHRRSWEADGFGAPTWLPVAQRAGAKPAEPPPPKLTEQELLEIDEELLAKAEAEGNESHARAHRRAIKARRDRMAAAAQQATP